MDVFLALKERRSVRHYKPLPVEEGKLKRVLEAARLAPSAGNRQPWKFVIVRDEAKREALAKAANDQAFVAEASVVIAACATQTDHVMANGQYCYPIDLAIAVDHMTLVAVEEGLGTCWIGAFSEPEVKRILKIPERVRVVALLPLGYPEPGSRTSSRKRLEQIVSFERFEW